MLGIAGAECDRSIPSAAVVYVTQNEDLHAHAAHKTFRMIKDHNSDRTTRGYVLTALTKLAGRLGEDQEDAIEGLLQTYSGSMNLELQARSCEFGQLLRPELGELRKGMLDRMPVADEETVRNRRARFRNEDVNDDDDEGRGLPSFRISKASKHRRGGSGSGSGSGAAAASARAARAALGAGKKTVQPLAGPAASAGGILSSGAPSRQEQAAAVPNLLDLDDLFGGGPGDSAAAAAAPGGEGKAATVDLMADIFSAKPAQPPAAAGVVDPFAPTPAPATAANGSGGGVGATLAAAAAAAAARQEEKRRPR
ncbi:unnamed protein product [Ectocarpus sp. 8 AP-2014]